MLPVPLDLALTAIQYYLFILLASIAVDYKIDNKKILIITAIHVSTNVFITPYVNLWIKIILGMLIIAIVISILTKLKPIFSVIITFFTYLFTFLTESIFFVLHFSYIKNIPADLMSDITFQILGVSFICTLCLICILVMKSKNFNFLVFNEFILSHWERFKPVLILIVLIQVVPITFYFINAGVTLYGSYYFQTKHIDDILSIYTFLTIFLIVISLSMLYLIKLIDKHMIKNAISILHGEYLALHEDNLQVHKQVYDKYQQRDQEIKNLVQRKQYNEIISILNRGDSFIHLKESLDIPFPTLRDFLQNRIYLAELAKIDFILEVDENLLGLEYYIEDSLLELLHELYQNAFEAAQEAEFPEVYSKFIRDEEDFVILINNNGVILPPTHQPHLFDLNYTSKKSLIHGYGLYKVKNIIDSHQGSIDIRGYDEYTRVTVELPLQKEYNLQKRQSKTKYSGLKLVKIGEEV